MRLAAHEPTGLGALPVSVPLVLPYAADALIDQYLANRTEGEDVAGCFSRLGAPGYGAILARAFLRAATAPR